MTDPTLAMLQRLLDEQRALRDDLTVLLADLRRFAGTIAGLASEVRAINQHMRDLEDRQ